MTNSTLSYASQKWFDVWNLINNFDIKHEKLNYQYQTSEISQVVWAVNFALGATKQTSEKTELDFYNVESWLNEIVMGNQERSDLLCIKINSLKDAVHRLYVKLDGEEN